MFGHYAIPADQPHAFGRAVCVDYGGGYRESDRSMPGFNGNYKRGSLLSDFPNSRSSSMMARFDDVPPLSDKQPDEYSPLEEHDRDQLGKQWHCTPHE